MDEVPPQETRANRDCNWEYFDCDAYVARNYAGISPPDRAIFEKLIDIHSGIPRGGSMIEIGAGPNLYPLLAASAYRDTIHVTDISMTNLRYLQEQMEAELLNEPWHQWVRVLRTIDSTYECLDENLKYLRDRCTFEKLSIFDIGNDRYDFCSMHFVAESITNDYREFVAGCDKAMACLRMGGHFAMSFMLSSQGYMTGDVEFPAVSVDEAEICRLLTERCRGLEYMVLMGSENVVREGHTGILLAYGMR